MTKETFLRIIRDELLRQMKSEELYINEKQLMGDNPTCVRIDCNINIDRLAYMLEYYFDDYEASKGET